jgi:hypothetical protein
MGGRHGVEPAGKGDRIPGDVRPLDAATRQWRREHVRQWRDIRLTAFTDFASAFRQYVAFALEPKANIGAMPHPRMPAEMMPFFDESGTPHKDKLESTALAVYLVCEFPETVHACMLVCRRQQPSDRVRASRQQIGT